MKRIVMKNWNLTFEILRALNETVRDFAMRICDLNECDEDLAIKVDELRRKCDLFIFTLDKEKSFFDNDDDTENNFSSSLKSDASRVGDDRAFIDKAEKESVNLQKKRELSENKIIIAR